MRAARALRGTSAVFLFRTYSFCLIARARACLQGPDPASAEAYTRFDVNAKNCRWCVKKVLFEWINNELLGQEFFWCSGLQEVTSHDATARVLCFFVLCLWRALTFEQAVLTFAQDNDIQLKDLNLALQKSRFGKRKGAQSTVHDTLRFGTRQRRQESVFELPGKANRPPTKQKRSASFNRRVCARAFCSVDRG